MNDQDVEMQAKIYVYDLNNCAKENGFKVDELWELSLASAVEKLDIEKKYYVTISTKVLPEILLELFRLVKGKLMLAKSVIERNADTGSAGMQYLVAYNPKRPR